MEKYILNLDVPYDNIVVEIHRKNIKNVHLKVDRDYRVKLSLPNSVSNEWIEHFLNERKEWILKQLFKYKQSSGYNNLIDVKSGTSTQLLGKDRRIIKKQSNKNYVVEDEKRIILYLKDMDNIDQHQIVLEKWWRKKALEVYTNEVDMIFNKVFKKYNIEKPTICIRKMKTLWGSCTPAKNKITLNEYLLKAERRCIHYVVLHELTHLLYPYHNQDFYNFLTIQMPDWTTVKRQLDEEVVQGL